MGAGNLACQFSKVGLCLSRLPSTQKVNTIGGKVGLNSTISDFSVQNRKFIARMAIIWCKKAKDYCWKEFLGKILSADRLFCV